MGCYNPLYILSFATYFDFVRIFRHSSTHLHIQRTAFWHHLLFVQLVRFHFFTSSVQHAKGGLEAVYDSAFSNLPFFFYLLLLARFHAAFLYRAECFNSPVQQDCNCASLVGHWS
jgi:hypothetical protein